jgi:hypothetical protein
MGEVVSDHLITRFVSKASEHISIKIGIWHLGIH